jgi:hypothetical protein
MMRRNLIIETKNYASDAKVIKGSDIMLLLHDQAAVILS